MITVTSSDQVQSLIKTVKDERKGYLTNFYPDYNKIQLWIKSGLLEYDQIEESVFFFKKNKGFRNLYFCSTTLDIFKNSLNQLMAKYKTCLFAVDLIGKNKDIINVKTEFIQNGFLQYTSLVRMNRIGEEIKKEEQVSNEIFYAGKEECEGVYNLLQRYFDAYAEQLPLMEEIHSWASANRIIIYPGNSETILGFAIFEITGLTAYLRYWFVHPSFRDKKIGSKLLNKFFEDSSETKRQLFWVIENNENAIKRYEHYGFRKEDLFDFVLTNTGKVYHN